MQRPLLILTLLLGCAGCMAPGPWTHADPERSRRDELAVCEREARQRTLEERGGRPDGAAETRTFQVTLRRHRDACMQENGWRRAPAA